VVIQDDKDLASRGGVPRYKGTRFMCSFLVTASIPEQAPLDSEVMEWTVGRCESRNKWPAEDS
jgi:hypothetical protein